jgi:hypothetical protein
MPCFSLRPGCGWGTNGLGKEPVPWQPCSTWVMTRMPLAVLVLVLGFAAATSGTAAPSRTRTVPCSESIDGTKFPYVGGWRAKDRYRLVLGVVSVPPAYHEQIVHTRSRRWRYAFKAGLVIRASRQSVAVSVPRAWRDRAAIAWGYGGNGVFTSLRFAGCKALPTQGFAYSGAFYLRPRGACLPLIFRVGRRSATVRFGLGRRC